MKLSHSKEDCIEETDCKKSNQKHQFSIDFSIWSIINVINAVEVVSELVDGEIEFRFRGAAAAASWTHL